jgi:hypothetical protein
MRSSTTLQPQPAGDCGSQPTLLFGLSVFPTPASCPEPLLLFVPTPLLLPPPLLLLLLLGTPPDEEPLVLDPLELVLEPELLLVLEPLLELVLEPLLDPELLPLLLPLLDPELLELPDPWRSAPFGVPQPVGPS